MHRNTKATRDNEKGGGPIADTDTQQDLRAPADHTPPITAKTTDVDSAPVSEEEPETTEIRALAAPIDSVDTQESDTT